MKFLRGIALGFWIMLMTFCVSLVAAYYILSQTILNPAAAKSWLNDSGAYSSLAELVVPQVATPSEETVVRLVTPDMVQRAAKASIKPEAVKAKVEPIVDATYAWLDSKSPEVTFSISTTAETDAFLAALRSEVLAKIKSLPICEGYVDTAVLETATCLPGYVTAEEATDAVMQRLGEQETVRAKALTPEVFSRQNKPNFASNLPDIISLFWVAQLIAIPVFILIALWLLAKRRGGGLVAIASSLLTPGLTLVILAFVLQIGGKAFVESLVAQSDFATVAAPLGREILKDLASVTLLAGAVLSGVALVAGGLGIWWRRRSRAKKT